MIFVGLTDQRRKYPRCDPTKTTFVPAWCLKRVKSRKMVKILDFPFSENIKVRHDKQVAIFSIPCLHQLNTIEPFIKMLLRD